jgi:anaerobic selenocysteine-containing dehydrogenase
VAIVTRLAKAVLGVDWSAFAEDYAKIRDRIERVIPGFEGYNERINRDRIFVLPNSVRERRFITRSGKAEFTLHPIPRHELRRGELLMMTIRSHDQFNTTIYSQDDRYRGIYGNRRVVLMNDDDIRDFGLRDGSLVDLECEHRRAEEFTVVAYPIPRRCAATYFPEANVLVPVGSVAERSNTPASKSVVTRVTPRA